MPDDINDSEIIQFVGIDDLDSEEELVVQELSSKYFKKIKRETKNLTDLKVHVKKYKKEGNRQKYSIHIKAEVPSKKRLTACRSHDWQLEDALHDGFQKVIKQAENKFRDN